ncbi:MAG: DUF2975 domain-containing protein [Calditrichaeota bacterium]|nr:DUF2975 domain-containing protein [Calditrichota bacterium]RQW07396.1 MAG: DUF2975 domain-containing protein [Calditrichota bacterium]
MKQNLSITGIKWTMNIVVILLIINAVLIVIPRLHKIWFKTEEIKLIRLEIPWIHPVSDVTIMLYQDMLKNNQTLHKKISKNVLIHDTIERIIQMTLFILIVYQLTKLIIAIRSRTFFTAENLAIIRNLSLLVFAWIIGNFLVYQLIPVFIPLELMYERINFTAFNESWLENFLSAIDFKMLLVAIILYIISLSFKEGYRLKEETELTI